MDMFVSCVCVHVYMYLRVCVCDSVFMNLCERDSVQAHVEWWHRELLSLQVEGAGGNSLSLSLRPCAAYWSWRKPAARGHPGDSR